MSTIFINSIIWLFYILTKSYEIFSVLYLTEIWYEVSTRIEFPIVSKLNYGFNNRFDRSWNCDLIDFSIAPCSIILRKSNKKNENVIRNRYRNRKMDVLWINEIVKALKNIYKKSEIILIFILVFENQIRMKKIIITAIKAVVHYNVNAA